MDVQRTLLHRVRRHVLRRGGDGEALLQERQEDGNRDAGKKSKGRAVYYKPACATVVWPTSASDPDAFTGEIYLYFAPSTGNNFPGMAGKIDL